jgi:hypothetical protein
MNGSLRANEGEYKSGMTWRLRRVLPRCSVALAILFLLGMISTSLRADYLANTDLKDGFAWWHGDGEPAFLTPDGTEGAEDDPHVIPVIKIRLSKGESSAVDQEYETKDDPKGLHVHIEVYASDDFKRSMFADDYSDDINWKSTGTYSGNEQEVPNADFWIHDSPSGVYHMADLKPGQWVSIDCHFNATTPADERTIFFGVPPGDGTIYIRNASVTP